jgi:hypothetical protein
MNTILFFILAPLGALCLSFLASLAISRIVKRKSALPERVRISSIEDASVVLRRRRMDFTMEERSRLLGDAMNIIMTAESEEIAVRYVERIALALGDDGVEFRKYATSILEKSFHKSEFAEQ